MYLIILVILITELIIVSNGEDNYFMSDSIVNVNLHYMNNIVVLSGILEIQSSLKMERYVRSSFVPPTYQRLVSNSTIINSPPVQIYMKCIPVILQLHTD